MTKASIKNNILILCLSMFLLSITQVHAANILEGNNLYNQHCSSCHGSDGNGQMPGTPNFSRGEGLMNNDVELKQRILDGKFSCPSYFGILSERKVLDVISYLRTFY